MWFIVFVFVIFFFRFHLMNVHLFCDVPKKKSRNLNWSTVVWFHCIAISNLIEFGVFIEIEWIKADMCGVHTVVYGYFKPAQQKFLLNWIKKTCRKNIALAVELKLGQKWWKPCTRTPSICFIKKEKKNMEELKEKTYEWKMMNGKLASAMVYHSCFIEWMIAWKSVAKHKQKHIRTNELLQISFWKW